MTAEATCATCGAAIGAGPCPRCLLTAELPPVQLGESIVLEDELGRGGMGAVFRARHTKLGRAVAVKLLPPELAADPDARARFEREARALAQLSHANIVQVHDFGEAEGQPFIVMELVNGRSLASCIPRPPAEAVRIAIELCEALAHAHAHGVIHRDVKPSNVMLDEEGHAKLGDFGIARLTRAEHAGFTVTAADRAAGTPAYLAPEVLRGAPPDPRADIFSLGKLLNELVTQPLPGGIARIVQRATASDPAQRFQSALELRAALVALRADERSGDLPDDELFFLRGAALLCTASAAMGIWAGVQSLTPRVIAANAIEPLTQLISRDLPDGRVVSYVRFEVAPILIALLGVAFAFTALGLLRRHWRLSGLDAPRPMLPLRESRTMLWLGGIGSAAYALRVSIGAATLLAHFPPLIGGLFELFSLFVFFEGMLQAWRTARPLSREPLLFLGLVLLVIPPIGEFFRFVASWHP